MPPNLELSRRPAETTDETAKDSLTRESPLTTILDRAVGCSDLLGALPLKKCAPPPMIDFVLTLLLPLTGRQPLGPLLPLSKPLTTGQ